MPNNMITQNWIDFFFVFKKKYIAYTYIYLYECVYNLDILDKYKHINIFL